mmetsp:Transcript_67154/g.187953  ORF Transcript_67154/g.187953 Transcript_67154/m.187953 type:complete len:201 (-) Transcript_67154:688-1290(-)
MLHAVGAGNRRLVRRRGVLPFVAPVQPHEHGVELGRLTRHRAAIEAADALRREDHWQQRRVGAVLPVRVEAGVGQRRLGGATLLRVPLEKGLHPSDTCRRYLWHTWLGLERRPMLPCNNRLLHLGPGVLGGRVGPSAEGQDVSERAECPRVNLCAILLVEEHLRSHVWRCAEDTGELASVAASDGAGQAEVAQLRTEAQP